MKHVYLFSGLGVDHRAYQNIDLSGVEHTFIQWIAPNKRESMTAYAKRLMAQITSNEFIFIGVSFGGMIAVEVAKFKKPDKIIMISSAKIATEIPAPFRFLGRWLRLHYLIPTALIKKTNQITYWLFGTYGGKNKKLLKEIITDTQPEFFRWAINEISLWNNKTIQDNIIHIHGTADRILPYKFVTCNIAIKNGGHFMLVDKAEEINTVIREILAEHNALC